MHPHAASLSFLLSQTGAHAARLFAERLAAIGVTPRAYGVLSSIAAGGGQTQQQLADALGMHRNNMVGLIDDLEGRGWVRRVRSDEDRRAFTIELTPPGQAVLDHAASRLPQLDADLAAGLSAADRAILGRLLRRVADGQGLTPGVHPHLRGR